MRALCFYGKHFRTASPDSRENMYLLKVRYERRAHGRYGQGYVDAETRRRRECFSVKCSISTVSIGALAANSPGRIYVALETTPT